MAWRRLKKQAWPDWLYISEGKEVSSYWVRHRKSGLFVEQRLEGNFKSWLDAKKAGLALLRSKSSERSFAEIETPVDLVRTESLCDDIVHLAKGKAKGTHEQTEIFMRVHLKPFLNEHAPYARDLNATIWERYKVYKRLLNPTVALFNHWKFFVMLFGYAHKKGLIKAIKLEFNEGREDFRERGNVIPDEDLVRILNAAKPVWKDRIIIGRRTGMRPGEVRNLHRSRIDFERAVISLRKEDTKTRQAREFKVGDEVLSILKTRLESSKSDFVFPKRGRPLEPSGNSLRGWHEALELAKITKPYTPHDLRHTRATEMFRSGIAPGIVCYILGMSIEEAQKTYLHFSAEDTAVAVSDSSLSIGSPRVVSGN